MLQRQLALGGNGRGDSGDMASCHMALGADGADVAVHVHRVHASEDMAGKMLGQLSRNRATAAATEEPDAVHLVRLRAPASGCDRCLGVDGCGVVGVVRQQRELHDWP